MHTAYYILHTVNRILQNSNKLENNLLFCKIRFTVCSIYVVCILYLPISAVNLYLNHSMQYVLCILYLPKTKMETYLTIFIIQ